MSDSANRAGKGLPLPDEPVPRTPEAATDEPAWDDNAFDTPPTGQPTESLPTPVGAPPPLVAHGDNQPTVISRPPTLTGSGEHPLNSLKGKRLAHFELISPIGVGGMAAVIKGRDLQLDRLVALKVLPPDMAVDPENVRRFHQEARAAAKLDHENIARVFYCGEDQHLHFIAFEFVQGENLRTILERRGRLPVGEAVHYVLQVATGLAHAAGRGVVHRDIKPSNIIITPAGRAKLVDMGLARTMTPHDDRALTQSGVTLGTFDYISPEQALEPRDADARSDIYSLGCTLYHMLTGQPPVPEGTAAKKLHYHQHEFPVDPRQLNPDVPDEVAAILSRMMAKSPRDRYQKPEELVEELLRIAQKLESVERTDGLLYVDAPVPSSRSLKPLILVGLAVVAVVALVIAVQPPGEHRSSFNRPTGQRGSADARDRSPEITRPTDKADPPRDDQKNPQPAALSFTWTSGSKLEELRRFADSHRSTPEDIEVVLSGNLDLTGDRTGEDRTALTLRGKKITLRAAGDSRPWIWLRYSGNVTSLTTALALLADEVKLSGVGVVVFVGGQVKMTGVRIAAGKVTIEDCQFFQQYPSYSDETPTTALLLDNGAGLGQPSVDLRRCVFVGEEGGEGTASPKLGPPELKRIGRGGRNAVIVRGPQTVTANHCVFGPHQACFRLEGTRPAIDDAEDLKVRHCSGLLAEGSAFLNLDERAATRAGVEYSLFSRPQDRTGEPLPRTPVGAVLIRQEVGDSPRSAALQFTGNQNRYHNLDGFWADLPANQGSAISWKDFESRLKATGGTEARSQVLDAFPWNEPDPLAALQRLDLAEAFRVKTQLADLRLRHVQGADGLIGSEYCSRVAYNPGKLPPPDRSTTPETVRKEKIVDPAAPRPESGIFETLGQALEGAKPGDVVLIRHNGKLLVNPLALEKVGLDVVIRPMTGFRPVLTLSTVRKEAALFQLHEGRIEFQDLDFLLEPQKDAESQCLLAILGDHATCKFKNCTVTLAEPQGCQLCAVTLADPGSVMRRPIRPGESVPPGPTVEFDHCLVRGKGDLLSCKASRPFRLEVRQTLAAIGGSLLTVEGSKFAESLPAPGAAEQVPQCFVILRETTAIVSGPLFNLRTTGDLKSLVPIRCQASGCLFAPLNSKPLVLLSGLESKPTETALKERLEWTGGKNAYGGFLGLVEQQLSSVEMMRPRPIDRDKWKELTGETDSKFVDQVKFTDPIDTTILPRIKPTQCAATDLKEFGAPVDELRDPSREDR